jgi:serine/threonine protein kinase
MVCSAMSDMWSFGVIMYELYVGKRLFDDTLPEEDIATLLCSVSNNKHACAGTIE